MAKIARALISVYDKTGLVHFARALVEEFGIELLSTGGTARALTEAGLPVTLVESVTGFPEMMDGRVKTLHPAIHGGILADRANDEHMRQLADQGIAPIDMVVVNLYPFADAVADADCTFEQAIEMIDIGGPCLTRAAAKNHRHVLIVPDSGFYDDTLMALRSWDDEATRRTVSTRHAVAAFAKTSAYDRSVSSWLERLGASEAGETVELQLRIARQLRYGENPHQQGELLCDLSENGARAWSESDGRFAGDKQMSFNNYLDANAAIGLCHDLTRAGFSNVACIIKHNNPCGVGVADAMVEAYRRAYLGDVNAAMGGIMAFSQPVDLALADAIMASMDRWGRDAGAGGYFAEVIAAPSFDDDAVTCIRTSKKWGANVRLLAFGVGDAESPIRSDYKCIAGGFLRQDADDQPISAEDWRVVTERTPTDEQMRDLKLAAIICKHTKSNAITICREGMLVGNGVGQVSRVTSCRLATWLARENGHEERLDGAVAASDAFFPFRDGPDLLIDAGVLAIVQPGGSKRDEETFAASDERGVAMVVSGTRHFRH